MARKLRCTVTGNWSYCSEERFQALAKKHGSITKLNEEYISRQGRKLVEEHGSVAAARKAAQADGFKNKIECNVTGELCYISDARMKKLVAKHGTEEEVRKQYISRVANRLMKDGMTKAEIRKLAKEGKLPAPTSGKKTAPATGKKATPAGDQTADNAPAQKQNVADLVGAPAGKKSTAKKSTKKKASK